MKKKVPLACEKCKRKNYYENKSKMDVRLEKVKFCKNCQSHEMHKEEK